MAYGLIMPAFLDLTNQIFGRLTVLSRHPERKDNRTQWICQCSCENKTIVVIQMGSLRSGATQSCGCLQKEAVTKSATKHGLHNFPEYRAWAAMKDRCYNEKNEHYKSYGGRGITVCDEWKESFEAFYRDMGARPTASHSLDREDNDKGYCKSNCRWVTQPVQARNRRTNVFYEHKGEKKILKDWCASLSVSYNKTYYRMFYLGWTFEEAIQSIESIPITFENETKCLFDWCDLLGLPLAKTALRILRGEIFEDIVANK
jgi:hypothetical protein